MLVSRTMPSSQLGVDGEKAPVDGWIEGYEGVPLAPGPVSG